MPPKPTINKDDIINAAFALVREKGIDSINARSLANKLNCSTNPLFRIYTNMEELKKDVFSRADAYLGDFLLGYQSSYDNPLLNIGLAYVEFAKKERNLFRLIYLSNNFTFANFKQFIHAGRGEDIFDCISVMAGADADRKAKEDLYVQLLIYCHGLAALAATNDMELSEKTVAEMLVNAYLAFVKKGKGIKKEHV
ncbi:MAG: TetR/AcrR family transcriptional regulator [Eubacteriales bacterium]|nr:TetR/AcrR family transcriptional regulator [Eubacteriales bacterium]